MQLSDQRLLDKITDLAQKQNRLQMYTFDDWMFTICVNGESVVHEYLFPVSGDDEIKAKIFATKQKFFDTDDGVTYRFF